MNSTSTTTTIAYQEVSDTTVATTPYNVKVQDNREVVYKTEETEGSRESLPKHSSSTYTIPTIASSSVAAELNSLWETYAATNYDITILPTFNSQGTVSAVHQNQYQYCDAAVNHVMNMVNNDTNSLMSEESSSTVASYPSSTSSSSPFSFETKVYIDSESASTATSTVTVASGATNAVTTENPCLPPVTYPCHSLHGEEQELQSHEQNNTETLNFYLFNGTSATPTTTDLAHARLHFTEHQQRFRNGITIDSTSHCHQYSQHVGLKDSQDINSVMYHQHLIPANSFLGCISPEHTFLAPPAVKSTSATLLAPRPQLGLSLPFNDISSTSDGASTGDEDENSSSDSNSVYSNRTDTASMPETTGDTLFTKNPTIVRQQRIAARNRKRMAETSSLTAAVDAANIYTQKLNSTISIKQSKKRQYQDNLDESSDSNSEGLLFDQAAESQGSVAKKLKMQHREGDEHDKETTEEDDDNGYDKKQTRRTITSYDTETTFYLKSIFFEVFSQGLVGNTSNVHRKTAITTSKLTKDQRKEIQRRTGLPSRNITYWFSNHKRRFAPMLKVYKKCMQDHKDLKTYKDFIHYRRKQHLPEQIMPWEVLEYEAKYENSK